MRFHYGLYILLAVVSLLAVIFGALRAWGALGLVPLIFAALAAWMVSIVLKLEQWGERSLAAAASDAPKRSRRQGKQSNAHSRSVR